MKKLLIVLLILAALGGGGYTAWQKWLKDQPNSNTNNFQSDNKIPDGWTKYDGDFYSFIHPNDWEQDATTEEGSVKLKSADYSEKSVQAQRGTYQSISDGYLLEISKMSSDAPNETIQKLTKHIVEEEKQLGGGSHRTLNVDGKQALWVNNKHADTYIYAIVFHENERTHIQLNTKDDTDPKVDSLFETILASLDIK